MKFFPPHFFSFKSKYGVFVNNNRIDKNIKTQIYAGDVINISADRTRLSREKWQNYRHLSFTLKNIVGAVDHQDDSNSNIVNATEYKVEMLDLDENATDDEGIQPLSELIEEKNETENGGSAHTEIESTEDDDDTTSLSNLVNKNITKMQIESYPGPVHASTSVTSAPKSSPDALQIVAENHIPMPLLTSTQKPIPKAIQAHTLTSTPPNEQELIQGNQTFIDLKPQTQLNGFNRINQSLILKRKLDVNGISIPSPSKILKFTEPFSPVRCNLSPRDENKDNKDTLSKFMNMIIHLNTDAILKGQIYRDLVRQRPQFYDNWEEYEW